MLEDISRHALFHEMHRTIEEAATGALTRLMQGIPELTYPPNNGFLADELEALESLPRSPALERALRKIVANAAAYPLFHLMCLADGVADPPALGDMVDGDAVDDDMLHDQFYETYWAWRRRRPDPGWLLDTYDGE